MESQLSIHAGLGLPDDFKRGGGSVLPDDLFAAIAQTAGTTKPSETGVQGARLPLDQSQASERPIALKTMVGERLHTLFLMLGDTDFDTSVSEESDAEHSVGISYAVEPPNSKLLRGATNDITARYPAMMEHKHACRVSYSAKTGALTRASASGAMDGLSHHAASGLNSPVTLGVGREMLHAREVRYGGEMSSVFLRMWLSHLSVLAARPVTIRVDKPALRGALSGVDVSRESDRARVLTGVRVNARGLTRQALALLVIGCGTLNTVNGLHRRAERYRFRSTPLTLYGTTDNTSSAVELDDAHRTGAAIMSLASRFNAQNECAEALRAAIVLFGASDSGRAITLNCAEPDLHDDTVVTTGVAGGVLTSNSDLGDKRLLSLALFAGRVWRQTAGHMLRASMATLHATDVDAAGAAILPMQRTALREVGAQVSELFETMMSLVDSRDYVMNNYGTLWSETGIAHALAYGVVVSGSVAAEATAVIHVPYASSLTTTDDPSRRVSRARDVATLLLVQSLVSAAGEDLVGSDKARVRRATAATQFTTQVVQLGGGDVQFTLLGVGSGLTVQLNDNIAEWAPPAEGHTTLDSEAVKAHYLVDSLTRDKNEPNVERVPVEDLMETALPRGSIMRRIRGMQTTNAFTGAEGEGVISVLPGHEDDVVAALQHRSMNVVPTSGHGLMCGANALVTSLAAQADTAVDVEQLTAAIQGALSEEDAHLAAAAGVPLEDRNFTADQLAAGLQSIGAYDLVAVVEDQHGTRAYRVPSGRSDATPVVIHNRGGHWSGISKLAGQPIVLSRSARGARKQ
ncbi:MAG: putative coat protein [Neofusicoccum parvum chrysovirus 1]|uniref:putative coat protein n=1 Tax=Neofusicoccum parvum chrysovirus 1 TaxID=2587541 RepID=UPI001BEC3103|nr:MAG: putative coat protein [Neofusicoccum parvum chrysovirus 1]QDB74976.1 MAG: putative coat protein [Neofusicoccum parvum chrysovirus 1]